MTDAPTAEADIAVPHRGRGRPKDETVTLTKAARARFDTLAAGSIEAVFQAVLTAATQDGDMAAAKLLIDRVKALTLWRSPGHEPGFSFALRLIPRGRDEWSSAPRALLRKHMRHSETALL